MRIVQRKSLLHDAVPTRRTLTYFQKQQILERDAYVCFYCQDEATQVNHIVPWSYSHDDSPENLVACCSTCNSIASDKMFASAGKKRHYILRKKGHAHFRYRSPFYYSRAICPICGETFKPGVTGTNLLCNECIDD